MIDINDLKKFKNVDKDDLLKLIGVEERRSGSEIFFTSLGLFTAGVLVGAGAALLLAPKSGTELRKDLQGKLQKGSESIQSQIANSAGQGASRTM
ncbi:MAG: YtxH domain-containing protein [Myxococcaceae bacterium]